MRKIWTTAALFLGLRTFMWAAEPTEVAMTDFCGALPTSWEVPEAYCSLFAAAAELVPDLQQERICVRERSLSTTMAARPVLGSMLFRSRDQRSYVIEINTNVNFDGVLLQEVPVGARLGLVLHELMHIKDYRGRNVLGVAQRGWQYLSQRGKTRFEWEIDRMVLKAGLETYLLLWAHFVMEESEASEAYKEFKREVYMTPVEIFLDLEEDGVLQDHRLVI
ncbi:hypothetical protein [Geofilum rhodophaeum]|uniref:hypothetical protein n=1 Tax=Geofilum rhodophaeum TaxID=1965019 RepID=UPI000B5240AE|nr:hypothetical protein [Geofilum rhodophaeum]